MKWFFLTLTIVILVTIGFIFWRSTTKKTLGSTLSIGNKVSYAVEIRDTALGRAQGLSGRPSLGAEQGMLFVFDQPQLGQFWMKDMNFPLDFVWINNFKVVQLDENIPEPAKNGGEIARITPKQGADMVLEINAGDIEKYGIKLGDEVQVDTSQ